MKPSNLYITTRHDNISDNPLFTVHYCSASNRRGLQHIGKTTSAVHNEVINNNTDVPQHLPIC